MSFIRGNLDVTIALSADTCYFIRTGKCSLSIVTDYAIALETKTTAADLLYCPRLYRAMRNRESMKPITVTPCECGHAEVVTGHQRACIASRLGMEMDIYAVGKTCKDACRVCDDRADSDTAGGDCIVTLKAKVHRDMPRSKG